MSLHRSLRAQLLVLIGAGLGLMLLIALAGFTLLSRQLDGYQGLLDGPLEEARQVDATNLAFKIQVQEWKNVLLRGQDADQRERYWQQFQKEEALVQTLIGQLTETTGNAELRQRLGQLRQAHLDMGQAYRRGYAAFEAAGFSAQSGDAAVKGIDRATSDQLSDLVGSLHERSRASAAHLKDTARRSVLFGSLAMLALGMLLALLSAWLVNRRISTPLLQVTAQLDLLSRGQFGERLTEGREDEVGRLALAANRLRDFLQALSQQLRRGTGELDAATTGLSGVAEHIGHGIREQFSRTDQVATAMHEMSATAEEVARHSATAARAADDADHAAQEGEATMAQTIAIIERMHAEINRTSAVIDRLESDSERIGSVLEVIRGIADQTNLLALNAAIEAARAGEAGRGFAVVADEVRNLSSRTASSISEIHQLIAAVQSASREAAQAIAAGTQQSAAGLAQVGVAGERLHLITTAVEAIRDMNRQIATAAEEQTSVAEDIARNLSELVAIAQSNETDLQRIQAASQAMQGLSGDLSGLAARLRD
ncbi:methyl-accepting chemotaxis protein [Phytopseudomonas dryadis]|uniref:Methyl-accepting chemotaxis protein n=2 Tax=Pseudomonadaceae TaxID=135621 RepID=A0A4Q9R346_9GAMM|nr:MULTISPECIES: HAMP domain-containing methyl-accepting chemotaxis protein [Pseudomonas]TBU93994.1 methyl-accepting chemotaxis protein [Pseudomonas dryadis]TBV07843.1 methyl-accepting chemotaxis protein [Pseudomonas dryadis]TBV19238.1 methyl-accepting chemotaxis protein [Pseudomonas sp. FRB 230]